MNCLNPVEAWICGTVRCKSDGVISPHIVFSPNEALDYFRQLHDSEYHVLKAFDDNGICLPCGHCINCLVRKRRDLSVRLAHEARIVDEGIFLTLTYEDKSVPVTDALPFGSDDKHTWFGYDGFGDLTLFPRHLQLFIKRLRRHVDYHEHRKFRFFAVGEYGSKTSRPHYHVLIFGWTPPGYRPELEKFTSPLIAKLWPFGFHLCIPAAGPKAASAARYCARYVTKKLLRANPLPDSVCPEFTRCSNRNGGMGAQFARLYADSIMSRGFTTVGDGSSVSKVSIPDYYLKVFRKYHTDQWLKFREARIAFASKAQPVSYNDRFRSAEKARYDRCRETESETM